MKVFTVLCAVALVAGKSFDLEVELRKNIAATLSIAQVNLIMKVSC